MLTWILIIVVVLIALPVAIGLLMPVRYEGQTVVEFQICFSDGAVETYEAPVTEENGEWKIGLHG